MSEFLLYYQRPNPATWVYLSSFLTIGLYFVFRRCWSIRNLDIVLLILLGPGLLLVHQGRKQEIAAELGIQRSTLVSQVVPAPIEAGPQVQEPVEDGPLEKAKQRQLRGFVWLFAVELLILIRLFCDPLMVRRPLLDPNLTTGGLVFIGVSMLVFLMGNVLTSTPRIQREQGPALGPGYPVLNMLPTIPTIPDSQGGEDRERANWDSSAANEGIPPVAYAGLARTLAILAHLSIIVGMVLIAYYHFGNFRAGAGCAALYLLLPYTAQMTGRVDHVLPAALLVWAILLYRRPLLAGISLGLAAGLVYYPAFLLPLWFGFYRQRGLARFTIGVATTIMVLTILLAIGGGEQFSERLVQMYGLWLPWIESLEGVWGLGWQPIWRLPILVAFVLLAGLYSFWPRQKNLGTLMSCSAALMVAAQFWHGFGGGLFIAWFLPLLLLTVFRPNLDDRVALKVIGGGSKRKSPAPGLDISAA